LTNVFTNWPPTSPSDPRRNSKDTHPLWVFKDFVLDGGLISYGPDRRDQFRQTAIYVDKILKGIKPADLPVQQPVKFGLVVNRKTPTTLGLDLPASIEVSADQVIE